MSAARCCLEVGAPGRVRTSDHLVRSQVLYPAELRALEPESVDYLLLLNLCQKYAIFIQQTLMRVLVNEHLTIKYR
jgi:hypothetical protein